MKTFQEAKSLAQTLCTVLPVMVVFRDYVGNVGTVYGPSMQVWLTDMAAGFSCESAGFQRVYFCVCVADVQQRL